ncbi:hypothetical protein [Sphingomonas sp.]|jgi:hypothetical protein|uniref:hypothetical protein n=1 Tax=Sphingomonas sp. TaxID=28214 RepID=UPI002EDA53E6
MNDVQILSLQVARMEGEAALYADALAPWLGDAAFQIDVQGAGDFTPKPVLNVRSGILTTITVPAFAPEWIYATPVLDVGGTAHRRSAIYDPAANEEFRAALQANLATIAARLDQLRALVA